MIRQVLYISVCFVVGFFVGCYIAARIVARLTVDQALAAGIPRDVFKES